MFHRIHFESHHVTAEIHDVSFILVTDAERGSRRNLETYCVIKRHPYKECCEMELFLSSSRTVWASWVSADAGKREECVKIRKGAKEEKKKMGREKRMIKNEGHEKTGA